MARNRGKTLRTISVRLGDDDANVLRQLRNALDDVHEYSFIGTQLRDARGRHTGYNDPVNEGETIRWAIKFALERFPEDLGHAPPPYDGGDRHRRTIR